VKGFGKVEGSISSYLHHTGDQDTGGGWSLHPAVLSLRQKTSRCGRVARFEETGMGRSVRPGLGRPTPTRKDSMTESMAEITALAWSVKLAEEDDQRADAEFWFVVHDWAIPDAHKLCEKGWLNRRIRDDVEWRLSDRGLFSLRMDALRASPSMN
jgi:hypothetical protein